MRRAFLASVVLLPLLAHAQDRSIVRSDSSTLAELALPATPAAAVSSALALTPSKTYGVVPEIIHTRMVDDFASTQAFDPISRIQTSAPNLKTASALGLAPQELAKQPAVIKVILDATIDAQGVPHNISVSHSGGKTIDQKAVAAVSEYRFQPAMIDNRPTQSTVSIAIKIQQ